MAISNYSDLQSQIASYLARSDLTSQIPTFIQLTEAKLQRKFVGVTSLSSLNTTNWMLTNNPDVYLYGALLEAQPYLMDDARIATWADIYTTVVAQVRYPSASANFTNYSGLQAAIEDWINRSDLTDAIPNFIRLAEVKFSIKFKNFTSLSVGSPTNSVLTNYPDVYLYGALVEYATYVNDTANLAIYEQELASRLAIIRVADSSSSLANYSGLQAAVLDWAERPDLSTNVADFIQLAETKLQRRFKGVTALSVGSPTNWLLTNYPDTYLYGSLVELASYLKDEAKAVAWKSALDNTLATIRYPDSASNFTDYTGLQAAIADWLERPDLANEIPNFIKIAESKFAIKFKNFTGLSVGSPTNSILTTYPDLYLYACLVEAATYIKDTATLPLLQAELANRMSLVRVTDTTTSFADYAGLQSAIIDWVERPDLSGNAPDFIRLAESKLQRKFKNLTLLSNSNTTNWLLTSYPDVYHYASLFELATYINDEARAVAWKAALDEALSSVRVTDSASNFTNYTGLQAAVADWLQRPDLINEIPNFIKLAETKFAIKFKGFTALSVGSPTNSVLTNYPDLYLYATLVEAATYLKDTANLAIFEQELATRMSLVRVTDTNTAFNTYAGLQAAIIDWVERPDLASNAPDFIKLAEVKLQRLFKSVTELTTLNTSNWLLTSYPDVYMYASLVEFAGYINDAQRAASWQALLDLTLKDVRVPDTASNFTDYSGLQAAVLDWLERPDLSNEVANFIRLAEERLSIKFKNFTALSVGSPTNSILTSYPDLYLYGSLLEATWYLKDNVNYPILKQEFENRLALVRVPDSSSNFTNYAGLQAALADWLERPDLVTAIPNFIRLAESIFQRKFVGVTSLSNVTTTNWLLTNYPDVYMYGALLESAPYLKDDARVVLWQAEYDKRIVEVRYPSASASFANYTGFTAMIADWLNRPDLTNVIPTFITMAQERLSQDIRVKEMLKVATTTATGTSVELPSDFLEMRELHFQGNPPTTLQYQTPDQFFRNFISTTSGTPMYYTLLNDEFQFAPSVSGTTTLQMLYYAKPVFISNSVATNIFLTKFPNALLYATLTMAQPYLTEDTRLQTWATLYQSEISSIMKNDLGKKYPNTALNVTVH